jgi:hypothetical protein
MLPRLQHCYRRSDKSFWKLSVVKAAMWRRLHALFIRACSESSRSRDAIHVLTSAFARYGKSMKRKVPHAIHKVSGINSDLRVSDRCLFDILA